MKRAPEQMRIQELRGFSLLAARWLILPPTRELRREFHLSMDGERAYVHVRVRKRFVTSAGAPRASLYVLIDTAADGSKYFHFCVGSASFALTQPEAEFLHQHAAIRLRDLQSEPPRCV